MKMGKILWIALVLAGILLSACGPSQAEMDATATQIAADIFSTQTAQAPTITATFTPTLTPTDTPVPTPTPTETPKPTDTPTITPTPQPDLMVVAPTLDDLPAGFVVMPPVLFEDALQSMPEGTYFFQFGNVTSSQTIMGLLLPVNSPMEQANIDVLLEEFTEIYLTSLGAGPDFEDLTGLEDIGDVRAGGTSTGQMGALSMRWEVVTFRRGEVIAILMLGYPDGSEPDIQMHDLALLIDERIVKYLSPGFRGNTLQHDEMGG